MPFPAPANTSKGSSAIAALGAMLATDWASTSGRDSVLRLKILRVAGVHGHSSSSSR